MEAGDRFSSRLFLSEYSSEISPTHPPSCLCTPPCVPVTPKERVREGQEGGRGEGRREGGRGEREGGEGGKGGREGGERGRE